VHMLCSNQQDKTSPVKLRSMVFLFRVLKNVVIFYLFIIIFFQTCIEFLSTR
jgi:hypothetical protein